MKEKAPDYLSKAYEMAVNEGKTHGKPCKAKTSDIQRYMMIKSPVYEQFRK